MFLNLRYNKQHIIPLEEVKLQTLDDEGSYKNGWLICTQGKSFAVYAATATEKQEWMAHIDKVHKFCFLIGIKQMGRIEDGLKIEFS